ncbi:MAG TPA: hypothetical protein VGB28_03465 [Actinomycetota bacterium]|jgi:hypothetical protein
MIERRLLRLNDRLAELREEETLVAGELEMHRHLHDDAARDAAVYDVPVERLNERDTSLDVTRFERALVRIRTQIEQVEAKRQRLLIRLG